MNDETRALVMRGLKDGFRSCFFAVLTEPEIKYVRGFPGFIAAEEYPSGCVAGPREIGYSNGVRYLHGRSLFTAAPGTSL